MTKEQFLSGLIITAITSLVAWLSARASAKASTTNVTTSSRVEMEKEAYQRARAMDVASIARQQEELRELGDKYDKLQARFEAVFEQNQKLNDDTARMTNDNYLVHRENTRIVEINEQMLSENRRLRQTGERLIAENVRLRADVAQLRVQLGIVGTTDINGTQVDTNPMMEAIDGGE